MNVLSDPRSRRPAWYVVSLFAGLWLAVLVLAALIVYEVAREF